MFKLQYEVKANFAIADDNKIAVIGVFFELVAAGSGDMVLQSIYPKLDGLKKSGHYKREEEKKSEDSFEVQMQLVPQ